MKASLYSAIFMIVILGFQIDRIAAADTVSSAQSTLKTDERETPKLLSVQFFLNEFLFMAISSADCSEVNRMLAEGASPNAVWFRNQITPLILASRLGHTELVRILLKAGARPNMQDNRGYTALMEAVVMPKGKKASIAYLDIINQLLNAGANVNIQNGEGDTVLMLAERAHFSQIAALLRQYA